MREQGDLAVDPFVAAMMSSLGDVAGREVLDACCGEGFFSRILASRGARVVAIDISPRLIEAARERLRHEGPPGAIDYRIRDMTRSIPDLEDRFALIASHLALNDVREHRSFAATLAYVASPVARLVVALNNPYSSVVRGHVRDYFENGAIGHYRGLAQRGIPAHYYHRTLGEYLDSFLAVGWSLTKLVDVWPGENDLLLPRGVRFPYGLVLTFEKRRSVGAASAGP